MDTEDIVNDITDQLAGIDIDTSNIDELCDKMQKLVISKVKDPVLQKTLINTFLLFIKNRACSLECHQVYNPRCVEAF